MKMHEKIKNKHRNANFGISVPATLVTHATQVTKTWYVKKVVVSCHICLILLLQTVAYGFFFYFYVSRSSGNNNENKIINVIISVHQGESVLNKTIFQEH